MGTVKRAVKKPTKKAAVKSEEVVPVPMRTEDDVPVQSQEELDKSFPAMLPAQLLKVELVPVYIVDMGDGFQEITGQPMVINGREWEQKAPLLKSEQTLMNVAAQAFQQAAQSQQ